MDKSHGPGTSTRGYKRVGWGGEGKLADPAQAKGGGGGCGETPIIGREKVEVVGEEGSCS